MDLEIFQKLIKNRPLSKKTRKLENTPTPQFLQWFLKVWAYKIGSQFKMFAPNMVSNIDLNSGTVLFSILPNFGTIFGSFLHHVWRLGMTLDNCWETLGSLCLQLEGPWAQLGRLGLPFWSQKSTLPNFCSKFVVFECIV